MFSTMRSVKAEMVRNGLTSSAERMIDHVLDRVREASNRPFLPSLKQTDLQFRIDGRVRQASCRDGPAIAGAHYDDVVRAGKTLIPSSRKDSLHSAPRLGNRDTHAQVGEHQVSGIWI